MIDSATSEDSSQMAAPHDGSADGYLSAQLRSARRGSSYSRETYASKAWGTFGQCLPDDRATRILDIGPGECEFAELLIRCEHYTNVQVLDRSEEVVELATRLGIRATHATDTIEALTSMAGQLDVVVLLHVLEHVPKSETISLLIALRTALAPGGRLLLEVPNMGDPLNGLYFRYSDFTHEVGFTEESLNYVLRQAGFEEIRYLERSGKFGRYPLRFAQRAAQAVLHAMLLVVNLPNGRQMRRRIGPVLSVCATT